MIQVLRALAETLVVVSVFYGLALEILKMVGG